MISQSAPENSPNERSMNETMFALGHVAMVLFPSLLQLLLHERVSVNFERNLLRLVMCVGSFVFLLLLFLERDKGVADPRME